MTYGYAVAPPPPGKPPVDTSDLVVSIIAMVMTVVGAAGAAFLGLMMMAFTDFCPPATCDVEHGVTLLFAGFGVAGVIAVVGIALTIVRLLRRLRAWPFAVAGLVLTGAACALALVGYTNAVS